MESPRIMKASGLAALLRVLSGGRRRRYRAEIAETDTATRKLQPIAEILAQSGREPQTSD